MTLNGLVCFIFFLLFNAVAAYERYYVGAQHNLLGKTISEIRKSQIGEKFDIEVNPHSIPSVKAALMKKFSFADKTGWEFSDVENKARITD